MFCSPQGHPRLVQSLATFFSRVTGHEIDPLEDVLVTVGAYQALFCAFQALIDEGDEVGKLQQWNKVFTFTLYLLKSLCCIFLLIGRKGTNNYTYLATLYSNSSYLAFRGCTKH